jgi:hypothetical protein
MYTIQCGHETSVQTEAQDLTRHSQIANSVKSCTFLATVPPHPIPFTQQTPPCLIIHCSMNSQVHIVFDNTLQYELTGAYRACQPNEVILSPTPYVQDVQNTRAFSVFRVLARLKSEFFIKLQ